MKISELLDPAAIVADLNGTGKKDVLAELTDALLKSDSSLVRDDVLKVLMERERLGSTGIGDGVAIPHGKLKDIDRLLISFGLSRQGVDFDSMDGKPAHLFFSAGCSRRVGWRSSEDSRAHFKAAEEHCSARAPAVSC